NASCKKRTRFSTAMLARVPFPKSGTVTPPNGSWTSSSINPCKPPASSARKPFTLVQLSLPLCAPRELPCGQYVLGNAMNRKLTITVSEAVYEGLHRTIGRRRISQFIEKLARPHVVPQD